MSANIVVIDDHPNNLRLLMSILTEEEYKVRAFINGKLALNGISKEQPDLVLLDVNMPEMDGYEVCRQLKAVENTKDIPVLFLSALGETADKVKGFDAGGVDFVTKPFEERELLARIKTHIELKKAREALKVNNQFLGRLNQVKNEFVGIVSHDLQNPISKIMMFSKYIEDRDLSPEKAKQMAAMINRAGRQMLKLVVDLLDLNQIEQGEVAIDKQEVDVIPLVQGSVEDFQEQIQKKEQTIVTQFSREQVILTTDPLRFQQILDNLISNAIKFSPTQTTIEVKIEEQAEVIIISVKDQGPGISEEDQQRLFQKFAKLSARPTAGEESTGLGLSIVKQLVEALGGTIGCESEWGQGARFWISLPK